MFFSHFYTDPQGWQNLLEVVNTSSFAGTFTRSAWPRSWSRRSISTPSCCYTLIRSRCDVRFALFRLSRWKACLSARLSLLAISRGILCDRLEFCLATSSLPSGSNSQNSGLIDLAGFSFGSIRARERWFRIELWRSDDDFLICQAISVNGYLQC